MWEMVLSTDETKIEQADVQANSACQPENTISFVKYDGGNIMLRDCFFFPTGNGNLLS